MFNGPTTEMPRVDIMVGKPAPEIIVFQKKLGGMSGGKSEQPMKPLTGAAQPIIPIYIDFLIRPLVGHHQVQMIAMPNVEI
jgi:hypothetical protein